jgi:hypothetical protein
VVAWSKSDAGTVVCCGIDYGLAFFDRECFFTGVVAKAALVA